ncbi:MAG: O-antigen ligase family protein [Candidatus Sericytochromatia bacterium]
MATGPLQKVPAQEPPRWLAKLSLADAEPRWGSSVADSKLVGGALAVANGLHDRLRGWIDGSFFARYAEFLPLGAVCLLFLASPFVGTGVNAALVLLALALVAFRLFCQPETRARFSSLDLAVVAFVMVHLVATGFSSFLVPSLKGLAKMMIYWAAFLTFRQVIQTRQSLNWVIGALLVAGSLEAAYGIFQWIIGVEPLANWEDPETLDPLTRVYSTLMNPNLLGGYLLPIFPLAVSAALVWKGWWRALGVAAAVLAPVCIWFTYSRGAMLGLVAVIGVYGLLGLSLGWPYVKKSRKLQLILGGGALAVFGGVALRIATSTSLQDRIMSMFTLRGHSSNSFRMNVWMGVMDMVRDNWLIGVGIGNTAFRKMYSLYMYSGFEALGAYNVFLEVLAEMGLIGLVVFCWLLLAFVARNLYTFWSGQGANRWWAAAILAAFAGTFVMGLFDTVFYRPSVQLQFWLLLALTIAISPRKETPAS